jgi:hypothetical protein
MESDEISFEEQDPDELIAIAEFIEHFSVFKFYGRDL